jgi:hypothetical protein
MFMAELEEVDEQDLHQFVESLADGYLNSFSTSETSPVPPQDIEYGVPSWPDFFWPSNTEDGRWFMSAITSAAASRR